MICFFCVSLIGFSLEVISIGLSTAGVIVFLFNVISVTFLILVFKREITHTAGILFYCCAFLIISFGNSWALMFVQPIWFFIMALYLLPGPLIALAVLWKKDKVTKNTVQKLPVSNN